MERLSMSWRRKESMARQKALLFEWGLLPSYPISRGEAARLIDRILTLKVKATREITLPSGGEGMKPIERSEKS